MRAAVAGAAVALLVLSGCSSNDSAEDVGATGAQAPAASATAGDKTGASTAGATPASKCSDLTAAQAYDQAIAKVPTTNGWNWDKASAELGGYDRCLPLSAITVTIESATSSSPYQTLMFHGGEYVGTATDQAYGFRPELRRVDDKTIEITFSFPKANESNVSRSGKAVSKFTWDDAARKVIRTGDLPDGAGAGATTAPGNAQVGGNCGTTAKGYAVTAGESTTCAFAMAVAAAYEAAGLGSGHSTVVNVASPSTGQRYDMSCRFGSDGRSGTCRGGNNAVVRMVGPNIYGG